MSDLLSNDIQYLPGVGPKRAELLNKELGIKNFGDLLYYFPYKYIDRTKFYTVSEIRSNLPYIQVKGRVGSLHAVGARNRKRLVAEFSDGTGTIELVWFQGVSWIKDSLKPGIDYIVFGKPTLYGRQINIVHPEIEEAAKYESQISSALQAHYGSTEKAKKSYLTSRAIQKLVVSLFKNFKIEAPESLPSYLLKNSDFFH